MDHNILGPGGFNPLPKKVLPFPLEDMEEQLADVYFEMDKIRKRIEIAKQNNAVNLTKVRHKQLRRMQYKINTAMALIKGLTKNLDNFWLN